MPYHYEYALLKLWSTFFFGIYISSTNSERREWWSKYSRPKLNQVIIVWVCVNLRLISSHHCFICKNNQTIILWDFATPPRFLSEMKIYKKGPRRYTTCVLVNHARRLYQGVVIEPCQLPGIIMLETTHLVLPHAGYCVVQPCQRNKKSTNQITERKLIYSQL